MNNIVFIVDQIGPIIVDEEYNDFRTFLTAHKLTGNLRYTFSKFYKFQCLHFITKLTKILQLLIVPDHCKYITLIIRISVGFELLVYLILLRFSLSTEQIREFSFL